MLGLMAHMNIHTLARTHRHTDTQALDSIFFAKQIEKILRHRKMGGGEMMKRGRGCVQDKIGFRKDNENKKK